MSQGVNQTWVQEHSEPIPSPKIATPPRPLSTWELFWVMFGACTIASTIGTVAGWALLAFGIVIFQAVT